VLCDPQIAASSMSSCRAVRGIVLNTRGTTRKIARNLVKNLHLAGTIDSKVQCNRAQLLVFSRFSSYLPSNDGNDTSGGAVGNTLRDEEPEGLDVNVGMSETPPPSTVTVSSTSTISRNLQFPKRLQVVLKCKRIAHPSRPFPAFLLR
jgi:hypothetical protein